MEKNLFDLEAMAQPFGQLLSTVTRDLLLARVQANLGVNLRWGTAWDRLGSPIGIGLEKPNGLNDICDFIGEREIYFCESKARKVWCFQNGAKLRAFLSEIPVLDIYVFDENANFLICFNDHEYIIVWGETDGWFEELSCRHS